MTAPQTPAGRAIGDDAHPAGPRECPACQGDGCTWHLSPTNGAMEIDGACPACDGTGRTPR